MTRVPSQKSSFQLCIPDRVETHERNVMSERKPTCIRTSSDLSEKILCELPLTLMIGSDVLKRQLLLI
jgi:hypothetical protein